MKLRPACNLLNSAGLVAKELLDILVCPECKQPLTYRLEPESLKCPRCHRVYPVRDGIPVLLIDEAVVED